METRTEPGPLEPLPADFRPFVLLSELDARRRERRERFLSAQAALIVTLAAAVFTAFLWNAFWMMPMTTLTGIVLTHVCCAAAIASSMVTMYLFTIAVAGFRAYRLAALAQGRPDDGSALRAYCAAAGRMNEEILRFNAALDLAHGIDVGTKHRRLLAATRARLASIRIAALRASARFAS